MTKFTLIGDQPSGLARQFAAKDELPSQRRKKIEARAQELILEENARRKRPAKKPKATPERLKKWRGKNKEKLAAYQREWRKKQKEKE
jgi:hypothetical protein